MFANALFYGQTDESAPGLSIGPFLLSGEQVCVCLLLSSFVCGFASVCPCVTLVFSYFYCFSVVLLHCVFLVFDISNTH